MASETLHTTIDSPVGPLLLAADAAGLRRIHFQAGPHPLEPPPEWRPVDCLPGDAAQQLRA